MLAVSTIAYAGLIYSGPLASGLQIGIPALLAGSALGLIVIAIRTGKPGIFGAPYGALAVIYALLPGRLGFGQHALTDPVAATDTVMMVCAFVSLFTGLVFWLLGRFRIAEFARFLPYPVVAGYIAAVGWLFIVGGLGVGTALHPAGLMVRDFIAGEISLRLLAPAAFGIIAIILARWLRHWTIVPGMLAISIAGFHANRLVQGLTIDQAVASGWLLGPFKPGPISVRLPWDTIGNLNFDVLNAIAPVVLTIVLVGSITTIMSNAGLEERLDMMLDGDREMETAGIATLVSGFLGGIVVAQHIPSTVLARRIGGHGRLAAVVAGLCCGCTLLAGPSALSLLPRFAIGGLLIFNGLDLLIDRVWATRRGLSAVEWGAVLLVLLTAMIAGFINAIVVGLALALVIFVLSYRRVPVIALSTSGAIHHSPTQRRPAAEAALRDLGDSIRIIRLQGYLFFLNTERLLREMPAGGVRYLILDFRAVSNIDSSAVATLRRAYHIARERNYTVNCTDLNESVRAQFALQQLRTASAAGFASSMTEAEVLLGGGGGRTAWHAARSCRRRQTGLSVRSDAGGTRAGYSR